MTQEHTINNITWIDLTSPKKDVVDELLKKYSINIPTNKVLDFELLPQLETDGQVTYCVLRFPRIFQDKTSAHRTSFEFDCIITDDVVITIHDIPLFEIDNIHANYKELPHNTPGSTYSFFGVILSEFYKTVRGQLRHLNTQLELVEQEVFSRSSKNMILAISAISKTLIDTERSINSHEPVIQQIIKLNEQFQSKNLKIAEEMYNEMKTMIKTSHTILNELRLNHQNMIAANTTNAVRTLSIITFLALPLSILDQVLGILYRNEIPEFKIGLLVVAVVVMIGLVILFKRKRWI